MKQIKSMEMEKPPKEPTVFTIGHSNHELGKFTDLLKGHRIELVTDIRSIPFSRFARQFNKQEIERTIRANGIKYVFLGKELGGRPKATEFYDANGVVLYDRLGRSPLFLQGIESLLRGINMYNVALMCSEENPSKCHRHFLVARVLADQGINVLHIRGDGTIQTEEELAGKKSQNSKDHFQLSFFEFDGDVSGSLVSSRSNGPFEHSEKPVDKQVNFLII
ncbi:MAG: DUF488 domain-containing protein [Thermodesulfobacteriota bacterium]|nr:DUF488 domain-containing protein [Thermodesulfobacteriota bacterium]